MKKCPCQSGKSYFKCCGLFISGKEKPSSPEELMRSRYSAYSKAKINYIAATMREAALENFNPVDAEQWARAAKWLGLKIIDAPAVAENDTKGFVEFEAYYRLNGKSQVLHECSEFHLIDGQWFYVGAVR